MEGEGVCREGCVGRRRVKEGDACRGSLLGCEDCERVRMWMGDDLDRATWVGLVMDDL